MVTVHFKLSNAGTVQVDIDQPTPLEKLLQLCAAGKETTPGSFIAVREGRVITGQTLIEDDDEINLFPALSGG